MKSAHKSITHLLAKLLVSGALLAAFLWRVPLDQIWLHLRSLDALSLITMMTFALATWLLSAVRLWYLLPEFPLRELMHNTFTGMFYGTVLPGQLAGDVIKAYRLARSSSKRGHAEAATLVDRCLAVFGLFVVSAGVAIFSPQIPAWLRIFFVSGTIAFAIGGAIVSSAAFRHHLVERFLPHDRGAALTFIRHLSIALHDCLRRPARVLAAFGLALVFHGLCVVIHVLAGNALHIDLNWMDWTAIYASVSLIVLLPFSIAGIGLREGGYVGIMALFGNNRESALSVSFVMFGYLLLGALIGLFVELYAQRAAPYSSSDAGSKSNERP